jgi:ABC-2 type transport system ATP-binding protein
VLSASHALSIHHLSKRFGQTRAVNKVDLTVNAGQIFALIGPNGSGKTTLIKLITGLLIPDSGHAKIFGLDINTKPVSAKARFGYVPDNPTGYDYLSGREFLHLTGQLRGLRRQERDERIAELSNLFPLDQHLDQRLDQYSRGNRQKISFLAALLAKPELLIIDEPVVGLDPNSIKIFGRTLKHFARSGGTVFFATHILDFAATHAHRYALMSHGRLIKTGQVGSASLEKIYQHSLAAS